MANVTAPKHFNTKAGTPPYRALFQNVSIVPANCSLAFISTQWAADAMTGELAAGTENDVGKQSLIVWKGIVGILKELGVTLKEVVNVTVSFREFNDEIGKQAVEGEMAALPEEWREDALKCSLSYRGVGHFHRDGIVYGVELVVAVPPLH